MADQKKKIGDYGEAAAAEYLMARGYALKARNYRTRLGEIDLIMQNERYLLFVEVKTRKANSLVSGEEAVDSRKQARLRAAAEQYLCEHATALQPRFDVICIELPQQNTPLLRWLQDAF